MTIQIFLSHFYLFNDALQESRKEQAFQKVSHEDAYTLLCIKPRCDRVVMVRNGLFFSLWLVLFFFQFAVKRFRKGVEK